ncbi:MAG: hypothetical protein BIFFINMI_03626 [Phycisphaerae bacterium]|nr:hypothetical protein [Phycisphaerae bacterium]
MNVLLTGHGKLGTPLAQRLVAIGHKVRVLSPGHVEQDHPWEVALGWLEDFNAVRGAMDGCELVIHNAAHHATECDPSDHGRFIASNVTGTANVLAAALAGQVRHVIHISSGSVLGTSLSADEIEAAGRARIVRDDDPIDPRDIYEASKAAAELLARFYRQRHGLSVTALRPGWFPREGDLADHEFVWRLLSHCVWVGDVISAVLRAIDSPAQGEFLIHAATPFVEADAPGLLADPAGVLRKYYPDEMEWWAAQNHPTPAIRWWSDITPAREQLGYEPKLNFPQAVARLRGGQSPWPTAGVQIAR